MNAHNSETTEEPATIERVAITPAEFAGKFGRSVTWAYRRIYEGKVKVLPGCRPQLIPVTEVERFLRSAGRYAGGK